MANDKPQLTPDQVEVFARIVGEARRTYSGLPLQLDEPDAEGNRDFSYFISDASLNVSGTAATFPVSEGPRITRLEITPADDNAELTAGIMKHVPLGAITVSLRSLVALERSEQMIDEARRNIDELPNVAAALIREATSQVQPALEKPRRHGGREPLTDDLLRDVALTYLEETGPGKPKKPLERMAAKYDKPEETVRTWVSRARKAGWLGPAMRGRAGAEPGPRLLAEMATHPIAMPGDDGMIHVRMPPGDGTITEERKQHALEAWRKRDEHNREIRKRLDEPDPG
jgi:hypothetical protein